MAASFLEGTGVSKSFGGLRVLNEVGFRVAEGEIVAQGDIRARHLPGPHRKLLELAMALAQGPRLVLLDEILAGLTPTEVGRATAILRRIRDEHGIGLFWIEHVMQAVMAAAERVIVLDHGEVIAEGAPHPAVRDARVLEAYLGKSTARSH